MNSSNNSGGKAAIEMEFHQRTAKLFIWIVVAGEQAICLRVVVI
jgi:hypothetical protein